MREQAVRIGEAAVRQGELAVFGDRPLEKSTAFRNPSSVR
jgi:hypothetical protein